METFGGCGPGNYAGRQIASIRIPRNQNLGSSSKRSQPRARQPQRFVWPIFVINSITKPASLQSNTRELRRAISCHNRILTDWRSTKNRCKADDTRTLIVSLLSFTLLSSCHRVSIYLQLSPNAAHRHQKYPSDPDVVANIELYDKHHSITSTNKRDNQ